MISTLNRMANSKNEFQGKAKKILTVCSAGLLRSPTAANILHDTYGFNTRACGHSQEYALIELDEVLMYWADEIVMMNRQVAEEVEYRFKDSNVYEASVKIVLDIPDRYAYGDKEMKKLILKQYADAVMIKEVVTSA